MNLNQITGVEWNPFFLFHFPISAYAIEIRWPGVPCWIPIEGIKLFSNMQMKFCSRLYFPAFGSRKTTMKVSCKALSQDCHEIHIFFLINFWICFETRINFIYQKIIKIPAAKFKRGRKILTPFKSLEKWVQTYLFLNLTKSYS